MALSEIGVNDPAYTFENFVVGRNNKLAYATCKSVASTISDSHKPYNPLFIYGPHGQGKTHLLMAIKHKIERYSPNLNIIYTNSSSFTNELIDHLSERTMNIFRQTYQNADVLLFDDVQFLRGKDTTQEEFFHLFNYLYEHNKQIVIASDRPPKDIQPMGDRLVARFIQGLLVDILPPDLETRAAIIKQKAAILGIDIPIEIVNFIAEKLNEDVRQLECVVTRLYADKTFTQNNVTLSHVQQFINSIVIDDSVCVP